MTRYPRRHQGWLALAFVAIAVALIAASPRLAPAMDAGKPRPLVVLARAPASASDSEAFLAMVPSYHAILGGYLQAELTNFEVVEAARKPEGKLPDFVLYSEFFEYESQLLWRGTLKKSPFMTGMVLGPVKVGETARLSQKSRIVGGGYEQVSLLVGTALTSPDSDVARGAGRVAVATCVEASRRTASIGRQILATIRAEVDSRPSLTLTSAAAPIQQEVKKEPAGECVVERPQDESVVSLWITVDEPDQKAQSSLSETRFRTHVGRFGGSADGPVIPGEALLDGVGLSNYSRLVTAFLQSVAYSNPATFKAAVDQVAAAVTEAPEQMVQDSWAVADPLFAIPTLQNAIIEAKGTEREAILSLALAIAAFQGDQAWLATASASAASDLFGGIAAKTPDSTKMRALAARVFGDIAFSNQDYPAAILSYQTAMATDAEIGGVLEKLGLSAYFLGGKDQGTAVDALTRAVETGQASDRAYVALARMAVESAVSPEETQRALAWLKLGLQNLADFRSTFESDYLAIAREQWQNGRLQVSLAAANESLALNETSAGYLLRGRVRASLAATGETSLPTRRATCKRRSNWQSRSATSATRFSWHGSTLLKCCCSPDARPRPRWRRKRSATSGRPTIPTSRSATRSMCSRIIWVAACRWTGRRTNWRVASRPSRIGRSIAGTDAPAR
jgi:hypothetical protein